MKGLQLEISKEMVQDYLAILKRLISPGPHELYPRILKETADIILQPLSVVFENSWRTSEDPEKVDKNGLSLQRGKRGIWANIDQSAQHWNISRTEPVYYQHG